MPRINLLPWRAEERQRRKRQFQLAVVAAVSAGFLFALLGSLVVGGMISSQRERNDYLRTQIATLDGEIKEIRGLEQQKQRLLA
ncbi:MAG: PilN domain-containing protein, partial [Gammaproteobacteria bacterium]